MSTILNIACDYASRGWKPIPVPYRGKGPILDDWGNLEITAANAAQYFNGAAQNIGVILGAKSHGLTDVDLDCQEAVQLAPHFLPPTKSTFGRTSRPVSHLLYNIHDAPAQGALRLVDPNPDKDGKTHAIIELRMGGGDKGAQTVFPGSVHESGQPIEWASDGEVAVSTHAVLKAAVIKIAVAALLVRYFPPKGSRHDAALALGGFLARAGWEVKDIGDFVENIRETAGIGNARGEDPTNLKTAAIDAAETHKRGEKNTYGLPGLQKFFGKATANAIAEWLEYQGEATYPLNLELAVKLWGEPSHKGKFNCQWGEDDTKKILNVIRGDWFDFEYNIGGGVRDLMKMLQARASNPDAAETSNNKALILQWHGDAPPAPQRWLIRNRLPETGAGLLVAQWGMYKTFCALDISAHVMMGWDWTGEPTYRQCGVLCIAKEGSSSIPMRLAALVEHIIEPRLRTEPESVLEIDPHHLPFTWADHCPMLLGFGKDDPLPILKATAREAQRRFMDQYGLPLGLIWIDTMSSAGGFADENDNAEAAKLMGVLQALSKATGAVVIGVDHLGKNVEAGTRGGSAKEANSDFVLAMLGNKDLAGNVSDTRMSLRKVREGPTGKEFPLAPKVVNMGNDQRGYPLTSVVLDWNVTRAAPPPRQATKSNALQVLEAVMQQELDRHGVMVKPANATEEVLAVPRVHVLEAFKTAYKPGEEVTDAAKRQRFSAELKKGAGIEAEVINGIEYLWPYTVPF